MRKIEESLDLADLAPARLGPAPAGEEAEAVTVAMFFRGAGVLIQELRLAPENLAIRLVRGDSMEPTLREGEPVLLDLSRRGAGEDGLYALLPPGARLPIYRRLQNLPSGAIRALCDNPSYQPFDFHLGRGEKSPEIVGRIIWAARRF